MTIATSKLGVVDFDDPQPTSEHPRDSGKREVLFGVPFSFNFDVAFTQLGELTQHRIRQLK
jgi:hypothetical protein